MKGNLVVIGLGYVGLPLAVAFASGRKVVGFDVNEVRIEELKRGLDLSGEVSREDLAQSSDLLFTSNPTDILSADIYIVAVPTPINSFNMPDLEPLLSACDLVGDALTEGNLVVFESTVYPGATEEECVPRLEEKSKLKLNIDFHVGYSPERINPGDKDHKLANITKITSGSSDKAADMVDDLYNEIVDAGTCKVTSIKVAEAAKVIENTQRDVNIALINELSLIFEKIGIDTEDVLTAAETKWNFLSFRPGLVGGHCIGVDPYYLTHKAEALGYKPEIILSGRRMNDRMGAYVAARLIKKLASDGIGLEGSRVLVLGYTFKENCSDTRNTKVADVIDELTDFGVKVDVYDPWVSRGKGAVRSPGRLIENISEGTYDGILIAVAHREFLELGADQIRTFGKKQHILFQDFL